MRDAEDGRLARGTARRTLLLDAAVRVVAEGGAGSLTHRAVAGEADVSVASVTYHFPSISDLRRGAFQHAGSSIGLELADLVLAASARVDDTPAICAEYAVRLLTDRRVETAAVFELSIAAAHDDELKPVVAVYQGMLAELLMPFTRDAARARTVGAAVQGLILVQMASPFSDDPSALGAAVADLIGRYPAGILTPTRRTPATDHAH
ncbi:MAG TPA: TetR family transcriptional regulator [Pseudolysinimonas sp.]|nr:TetR family transcriptional regulator [Pseudolysinimonas sp.]